MSGRKDAGVEGCKKGNIQERLDAMRGDMEERSTGKEGCWKKETRWKICRNGELQEKRNVKIDT